MNAYGKKWMILFLLLSVSWAGADTFKDLNTGESFTGFRTHKKKGDQILIFNADLNKFIPLDLADYQVTTNDQGRRDSVMIVKIDRAEILQSETISKALSDSILKAADSGPKAIVIQIDSPGGQGPYMKTVTEAVSTAIDDTGCRVAAFIPGGQYGGAFSAAAVVALACQEVYIAPTASIGAVGPMVGTAMSNEEYTQYLQTFSPNALSTFSIYAASLAQKHDRPQLLARALVDKQLAIAEVRNVNGQRSLVELSQRQEDQSVIRMITEGLSNKPSQSDTSEAIFQEYNKLLTLPSDEAIRWKMADKQASTMTEVLADLNLPDTPIVTVSGINSLIQKFGVARRNLEQLVTKIDLEEKRVSTLEDYLMQMEKIALTSTTTRETNRGGQYEDYRRGTIRLRTYDQLWDGYYNERDYTNTDIPLQDRFGREIGLQDRSGFSDRERVIDEQPSGNIQEVRMQTMSVLTEMVGDYQRAIGIARRWPGALPMGISLDTLQKNMSSAQVLYNNIQRRYMQGY